MLEERDIAPVSLVPDLLPKSMDEMIRPFEAFYGFPTIRKVSNSFDGDRGGPKTIPDTCP